MTQQERMAAGKLYDPGDEAIMSEQSRYQGKLYEYNALRPEDGRDRKYYFRDYEIDLSGNC